MERIRVGIVVYEDVEVLDFCGPFEVFSVARLDETTRRERPSPFLPVLVAQDAGPVTATGGLRVLPAHTFDDCPPLDILLVPGGWGFRQQMDNALLHQWLRERAAAARTLAAVCTGAMLLGAAGLLEGREVTTHWKWIDAMRERFPTVSVRADRHLVTDGAVHTSAGISAGIDLALKLVEAYCGAGIARATARHMEYPFPESDARRIVF